ncbi:PTS sugar transporter subunit IIC [Klebsiella pneumoniae]
MNIQLMNVAVDIIEQRLAPLANVLTRNNHITAMRDSFALAMPFVIVGSLLVPILFPPVSIDGASRFGQVYLLLRPILLPTFQLTIGLVALIVAFGASASLAKQYRLPERLCGLTGCLAFLLFIGIHGALIITGIMNPFWMTYLFENQQALAAGSPTLPHIYLQGFWDFYLLIGGIGSTLPLVLMAMRSRSRQLKSVAKIGLLPSLFNINEPILFGFPVIMNPVFLLPFLFVPLINACIAWYLTQLGILDRAVAMLPWSMPSPLGAAWSANGSWKNLCMSLFAMFNAWMLYRPFFKVYERQLAETER